MRVKLKLSAPLVTSSSNRMRMHMPLIRKSLNGRELGSHDHFPSYQHPSSRTDASCGQFSRPMDSLGDVVFLNEVLKRLAQAGEEKVKIKNERDALEREVGVFHSSSLAQRT